MQRITNNSSCSFISGFVYFVASRMPRGFACPPLYVKSGEIVAVFEKGRRKMIPPHLAVAGFDAESLRPLVAFRLAITPRPPSRALGEQLQACVAAAEATGTRRPQSARVWRPGAIHYDDDKRAAPLSLDIAGLPAGPRLLFQRALTPGSGAARICQAYRIDKFGHVAHVSINTLASPRQRPQSARPCTYSPRVIAQMPLGPAAVTQPLGAQSEEPPPASEGWAVVGTGLGGRSHPAPTTPPALVTAATLPSAHAVMSQIPRSSSSVPRDRSSPTAAADEPAAAAERPLDAAEARRAFVRRPLSARPPVRPQQQKEASHYQAAQRNRHAPPLDTSRWRFDSTLLESLRAAPVAFSLATRAAAPRR